MKKLVNGIEVELTEEEIIELKAMWAKTCEEEQKNLYKTLRRNEYPTIEEQLDIIFHNGVEYWKNIIAQIKNKYPKP